MLIKKAILIKNLDIKIQRLYVNFFVRARSLKFEKKSAFE